MFLFSLKFPWLQRLLNETMDISSWNVDHVLKTAQKWSSWSLIWEQDGTNVSFISHIHVRFSSCVISLIVLPTLHRRPRLFCFKLPSNDDNDGSNNDNNNSEVQKINMMASLC